jgi:cation transport ATPase
VTHERFGADVQGVINVVRSAIDEAESGREAAAAAAAAAERERQRLEGERRAEAARLAKEQARQSALSAPSAWDVSKLVRISPLFVSAFATASWMISYELGTLANQIAFGLGVIILIPAAFIAIRHRTFGTLFASLYLISMALVTSLILTAFFTLVDVWTWDAWSSIDRRWAGLHWALATVILLATWLRRSRTSP